MSILRKIAVRLGVLAALISITLLGVYATSPLWSVALARAALAPAGIAVDELVIRRPGSHELVIEKLSLTQRADAYTLRAHGRGIVLRYRWRELWQRRFDSLHADVLAIAVKPSAPRPATPARPLSIAIEPPSVWLARLPVNAITLPLLTLDAELAVGHRHLVGSASYLEGALQLQLADSVKPQLAAQLRADVHDQLALTLQREQTLLAQLHSRVDKSRRLHGELKVQIEPLTAVLQAWGLLDRGIAYSGALRVTWLGTLPAVIDKTSLHNAVGAGDIEAHIAASHVAAATETSGVLDLRAEYTMAQGTLTAGLKQAAVSGALPVPAMLADRLALAPAQRLRIDARAEATTLRMTLEPFRVELSGPLVMTATTPKKSLHAALTLAETKLNYASGWRFDTGFRADVTLAQLREAAYCAQRVRLQLAGSVAGAPAQGTLRITPDAQLTAKSTHWRGGATGPLRIHTGAPIEIAYTPERLLFPAIQLDVGAVTIAQRKDSYSVTQAQLLLREGSVEFAAPDAATVRMAVDIKGVSAPAGPYRTQPFDLQADLNVAQRLLRGDWSLRAAGDLFTIRGTLRHSLANGSGEAAATLPALAFNENGRYLPALFSVWPYPFDLSGGELGLAAHVRWQPQKLAATLNLNLRELSGFYDLNLFKGLSTAMRIDYDNGALRMPATPLTLAEVDAGIALRQLHLTASVTAPDVVQVRDLGVQLLGGRMYQDEFSYRWGARENTVPLLFEALHLNQLLTLEQNIEGSGILDGRLPVLLSARGVAVENGHFQARVPGGVIRYKGELPQSALAAVPELQLALDSLKNFHYTKLDMTADYAPSGDLILRTQLHGRNPDLVGARPVNFNLNIRENIPDLLRSIKLSRDIGDNIEKRIQDFYQKQSQDQPPDQSQEESQ